MQFSRYIFGQLLRTTLAVTVVIVGIVWLFQTIRLLELVINRGASFVDFILMSLSVIPLWLTIAVPIAAFVAVNWVFHRILTDRELTVMQAIGLSPMQIAIAPLAFGMVMSATMMVNSVFVLPSSFGIYKELQFKIRNNIPAVLLQDNVFIDIVDGMTILIGKHMGNGVAADVFIHDARDATKVITVTADSGKFVNNGGSPALVLQKGQRAELNDDASNAAMLFFDSHTLAITASEGTKSKRMPIDMNEDTILNLLNPEKSPNPGYYPERRAEGHYRIASPLLALALVLIATAATLYGQIRRDIWLRRMLLNIVLGIGALILLVTSRSLAAATPQLVFLMYLSIGLPILTSLWSLSRARPLTSSETAFEDGAPA